MIALALALGYLGSLAFAAWLIAWRARNAPNLSDALKRIESLEARTKSWDSAASYVEAKQIESGLRR